MASWRQSYVNHSQASSRESTYNDVPYVLINSLCTLVDFPGLLVDLLRGLADLLCGLAEFLGGRVNLLCAPINPPSSLVDALL